MKVYIAIEHDTYNDNILGVFLNWKDADTMIMQCGGYGDKDCALSPKWSEIQEHEVVE